MGQDDAKPAARAPWGLVGMLALVALVEGAVARRVDGLVGVDQWGYLHARRAADREAGGAKILGLGDSLTKYHVVPPLVRERSGRALVNLAVAGSQPPASLYLFRRALAAGARPEAVVVDFATPMLRGGPRFSLVQWPFLLDPAEAADLAWLARDATLFASVTTAWALPSLRCRASARARVVAALQGKDDDRRRAGQAFRRNVEKNGGAYLFAAYPPEYGRSWMTPEKADAIVREGYRRFYCDPINARAIDRILSLARSRGVRVFWVLPPVIGPVQDRLEASGYEADLCRFVAGWQRRYPNLTVVDARRSVADPGAFHDPNHLAAPAAASYSLALGDLLRDALSRPGSPGWARLPNCPSRPLPPGFEDAAASELALAAPDARRK
ncbi:MAG: hypothetical protein U0835_25095 [Isosphaeraceae bacterium]